ncbi:hypothetical protein BXZ70DRAFT_558462 [Cristinia sonorae]|uniref:Distal membrane-arm assembly complex protein 1-like domain-containing protein n=1 Tax=Cristinia sonorae TaxID=1940300 RepID=A0A8K0UH03_9AGAR|nr:hypothetical protein BXZ70DRAFT_558462 [Cristinia sonorae]
MSEAKGHISIPNTSTAQADSQALPPQDCLSCRIIGTGALGATGLYALNQSRAHAPGSPLGKRILAGVGVCCLVASALRWTKK